MNFKSHILSAFLAGALATTAFSAASAEDTIKVGVLHSLSGTMAISETTLKDAMLMLIEEQNKKGVCLARSSKPSSSTRPPTGRCLPKRPAN